MVSTLAELLIMQFDFDLYSDCVLSQAQSKEEPIAGYNPAKISSTPVT